MARVVVLGASNNPDRYSYQAISLLDSKGHEVFCVNPRQQKILGFETYQHLSDIPTPVDTLTLYVGPKRLRDYIDQIIDLKPSRVLFNPGTECPEMQDRLQQFGIEYEEVCTLVLLRTGQF